MDNTLVLVDGSSYFYRAFHALPPLSNSKGQALGAVYGVVNMIKRLQKDYPAAYVALVFDAKGKTFRDDMYPEYKANRPPMPDDLRSQYKPMIDTLDAMGYPLLIIEGVEADDVIGTLAVEASKAGTKVIISTGDKDMAQLVDENVSLVNTMSNTTMDIAGVQEKFGVTPELIIDYLALIGDKSDNVPGVPKCGPKTALKWLDLYGNMDGVMENADKIGGKVGEYLRDSLSFLPLSKELVTIKLDVAIGPHFKELKKIPADKTRLIEIFTEYELNSWLNALTKGQGATPAEAPKVETNYLVINDEATLNEWVQTIKEKKKFAFDTETTSLNVINAELVGFSLCYEKHHAAYIPLTHDEDTKQLDFELGLQTIKNLLEDENLTVIGQNLKYDINVLKKYDINVKATMEDTMLASYALNPASSRHGMDVLAKNFLDIDTIKFSDIAGRGKKQLTFNQIEIEKAMPYAAEDADITFQLHRYLMPRVKAVPTLKTIFREIEMPLMPILAKMEYKGIMIDSEILHTQGVRLKEHTEQLKEEAYAIAGEEFNLSSPKQLQAILFEKLGLPVLQKTPTGQASTAEPVMQELSLNYPLPKIILEYRSLTKLISTYIDALPRCVNEKTHRVHTSYNQAVTATGRLSSSEPNLQNIPVRTKEGKAIRAAFITKPGYTLLAADYSQVELRIMAHLSGDEGLVNAFNNGEDIHKATAAEVFNVPLDEVTTDQRRQSKAINFGLIYGMSAFGLAKQLDISRGDAQAYIDTYFARYPGVKLYMEETQEKAHNKGYVETLKGRRLYLPDLKSKNKMLVKGAERAAINAPMQGTAADIIKLAMIDIDKWLTTSDIDCTMLMQVHDELVFEIKDEDLEEASAKVKALMEGAFLLAVPLIVDMGSAKNWQLAH